LLTPSSRSHRTYPYVPRDHTRTTERSLIVVAPATLRRRDTERDSDLMSRRVSSTTASEPPRDIWPNGGQWNVPHIRTISAFTLATDLNRPAHPPPGPRQRREDPLNPVGIRLLGPGSLGTFGSRTSAYRAGGLRPFRPGGPEAACLPANRTRFRPPPLRTRTDAGLRPPATAPEPTPGSGLRPTAPRTNAGLRPSVTATQPAPGLRPTALRTGVRLRSDPLRPEQASDADSRDATALLQDRTAAPLTQSARRDGPVTAQDSMPPDSSTKASSSIASANSAASASRAANASLTARIATPAG
jgi:hypothetical protein